MESHQTNEQTSSPAPQQVKARLRLAAEFEARYGKTCGLLAGKDLKKRHMRAMVRASLPRGTDKKLRPSVSKRAVDTMLKSLVLRMEPLLMGLVTYTEAQNRRIITRDMVRKVAKQMGYL